MNLGRAGGSPTSAARRPPRAVPRARRVVVLALSGLAVLLSGCRVGVDLNVSVEADGSGTVEVVVGLDADALVRAGGDLGDLLATDDLVAAGWRIEGPALEEDGWTRVRIRHPFGNPDEAIDVLAQVAGPDGPFRGFAVSRTSTFAETRWRFTGRVDFSGGLEALGDEGLAAELDGEPLGESVDDIEARLGESLSRLVSVRVNVRLPGDVTSNATTKAGNGAVWQLGFGEDPIDLVATGTSRRTTSLVLAGVAAAAVLGLVLVALLRLARRVVDRGERPAA